MPTTRFIDLLAQRIAHHLIVPFAAVSGLRGEIAAIRDHLDNADEHVDALGPIMAAPPAEPPPGP